MIFDILIQTNFPWESSLQIGTVFSSGKLTGSFIVLFFRSPSHSFLVVGECRREKKKERERGIVNQRDEYGFRIPGAQHNKMFLDTLAEEAAKVFKAITNCIDKYFGKKK